jgi:hypothetical protein
MFDAWKGEVEGRDGGRATSPRIAFSFSLPRHRHVKCITCNLAKGKSVCVPCAQVCHAGHELRDLRTENFYCDCGCDGLCGSLATSSGRLVRVMLSVCDLFG